MKAAKSFSGIRHQIRKPRAAILSKKQRESRSRPEAIRQILERALRPPKKAGS